MDVVACQVSRSLKSRQVSAFASFFSVVVLFFALFVFFILRVSVPMASQSLPSTPRPASTPIPTPDESRTPGKWRHPQLNEIVRRQNAATFGDRSVKRLVWNGMALIAFWVFGNAFKSYTSWLPVFRDNPSYPDLALLGLQLFFVLNIFVALYPLFRPKDELADIPLTPTQRSLLGLNPSTSNSATPGSHYVTPPRYRVSSSHTGSPVGRSASPLSANLSSQRTVSGPSFSPTSSPLLYKAVSNGSKESTRRPSFGSSYGSPASPLARSTSSFKESSFGPATPSPIGGKRVNVGLSNKWLYERSRRLSTSNGGL